MAPARASAQAYATRRKRQLSPSCSAPISADISATTACCSNVGSLLEDEFLSRHGERGNSSNDALLDEKQKAEPDNLDYKADRQCVNVPSSPSTLCCAASPVSSTESIRLPITVGQHETTFETLGGIPRRESLTSNVSDPQAPVETTDEGASSNTLLTLPLKPLKEEEAGHPQKSYLDTSSNQRELHRILQGGFSLQKGRTGTHEAPPPKHEPGNLVCQLMPSSNGEEDKDAERESCTVVDENPAEELQTRLREELERQLSSAIPDKLDLLQDAGEQNDEVSGAKLGCCSAVSTDHDFGGKESAPLVSIPKSAFVEACAQNSSPPSNYLDNLIRTTKDDASEVSERMEVKKATSYEYEATHLRRPTQPQKPLKHLDPVSSPTAHADLSVGTPTEYKTSDQEVVAGGQQNTTALIKRRRCGSLGLDQSLRWQAMARRVPRIKGVCYSTTRHEWIAVGPLQAGSARKKNIYFSVPKHGFDGARRLAVECRRRLQAGVPVNVQEFVREQQLLYQNEMLANQPTDISPSQSDDAPRTEEIPLPDTQQTLGSLISEAARVSPKNSGVSSSAMTAETSPYARGRERPETAAAPLGRRRQRPRALRTNLAHALLQADEGADGADEGHKRQRDCQNRRCPDVTDASQTGFFRACRQAYATRESSKHALLASRSATSHETRSHFVGTMNKGELSARVSSPGVAGSARPEADSADVSTDVTSVKADNARQSAFPTLERGRTITRAYSSDKHDSTTAPPSATAQRPRGGCQAATNFSEAASAFLSSAARTSESDCSSKKGRPSQLRAAFLGQEEQMDDAQTGGCGKLYSDSGMTSTLSGCVKPADRGNLCHLPIGCLALSPARRSIGYGSCVTLSSSTARNPLQSSQYSTKEKKNDKGDLQQHSHTAFCTVDYCGRRSSTTSSTESHIAGLQALSEINGAISECYQITKDTFDGSEQTKGPVPKKQLLELWRRESLTERALPLAREAPQLKRGSGRTHTRRPSRTADRRSFSNSPLSRASQDVDSSDETTGSEICKRSNDGGTSSDRLNSRAARNDDVRDNELERFCLDVSNLSCGEEAGSSKTALVRERRSSVVTTALSQSATGETRSVSDDCQERHSSKSVSPGNAFSSGRMEYATLLSGGEENLNADTTCHELDTLQDAKQAQQAAPEDSAVLPDSAPRVWRAGSGQTVLAREEDADIEKKETKDENFPTKQTAESEVAVLAKAVCLMLVDLLRFCSHSAATLAHAGLQPAQVAFCKYEGVKVLRIALQDVSATREVTRKFCAYIEVFEASILANALPTSGGAAEILQYLSRLKQIAERGARQAEYADDEQDRRSAREEPSGWTDAARAWQGKESSAGTDARNHNERCTVPGTKGHIDTRRECQKWNDGSVTGRLYTPQESTLWVHTRESGCFTEEASTVLEIPVNLNRAAESATMSDLPPWYPLPRNFDEDVEQCRCTGEESPREYRRCVSRSRGAVVYEGSPQVYARASHPNHEQGQIKSLASNNGLRLSTYTDCGAGGSPKDFEKKSSTNRHSSSEAFQGQNISKEEEEAKRACQVAIFDANAINYRKKIPCKEVGLHSLSVIPI